MRLLIIILLSSLCSCSTIHRLFTKQSVKVDSVQIVRGDSEVKKGIDTSKIKTVRIDSSNVVIVELDTAGTAAWLRGETITKQPDLINALDRLTKSGQFVVSYNSKTREITSSQPIRKVTFQTDNGLQYSNFTGGIDTSFVKVTKSDSVHLKKQVTDIQKTVTKKRVPVWIYIIPILLILLYIAYRNRTKILTLLTGI